jgi:hypothetical protein
MATRIKLLAFDRAEPPELIRLALTMPYTEFAEKYGFSKQEVSQCVTGYRTHAKVRDALAKELGVARAEIDALLDRAEPTEERVA